MRLKIKGEQPFQVIAHSCIISPSQESYTLQFSADGDTYTDWNEPTPANENTVIVNFPKFIFFRLKNNNSDVIVSY